MVGWRRADRIVLVSALVAGVLIRVWLLPLEGLRGDLDQFVGWVHHIATEGLGTLYGGTDAGPVTFGPVMAYIWAFLALIEPAFATVTDASDPAIRAIMKMPATLADFGLAALVVYGLRERPGWAAIGAAAVLLHPVVFYVSAWWGQYESIFVLSGLGATIAAINGRNGLAAALVAVSLMTKPQAIPFVLPFAAWFWATGGIRELARAAAIGLAVIVVLWLPFIPYGGPAGYLETVQGYSTGVFAILSLRAWNPWWIVQELAAGGLFVNDNQAILGPLTFRQIGYVATASVAGLIALAIVRDPRPERLVVGLAASVMTFFTFMTQMHERYSYAAVLLVLVLFYERRIRLVWEVLGFVVMLNFFSAIPPNAAVGQVIPGHGPVTIIGSLVLTGCTLYLVHMATRREPTTSTATP
jgi:Gpi18-like mannosyltransferase